MLAQVQRFVLHGWPSEEPKGGMQQNWQRKELSVLNGCVLRGARVVVPPPGRERVIQELREIHVHPGTKLCVVGESGYRPGSQSVNLYQVSVKLTTRISLVPRPSRMSEKMCLVF